MKEELTKVLNIKLKYLNDNIEELNRLNERMTEYENKRKFASDILSLFEDNGDYNIYHLTKVKKEDFNSIVSELSPNVASRFAADSCNYDGLVYLINGINDGISIKLTSEQIVSIEEFVKGTAHLKDAYTGNIEGLRLAKLKFDSSDIEDLEALRDRYTDIIEKQDNNEYIDETDEIISALEYSNLSSGDTLNILGYLLRYNADIYKEIKDSTPVQEEKTFPKEEFSVPTFNNIAIPKMETLEEKKEESANDLIMPSEETKDETLEFNVPVEPEISNDTVSQLESEISNDTTSQASEEFTFELPSVSYPNEESIEMPSNEEELSEDELKEFEEANDETLLENGVLETVSDNIASLDAGISSNIVASMVTSVDDEPNKLDPNEVKNLFNEFELKFDDYQSEEQDKLLLGDIDTYRTILNIFKENGSLGVANRNHDLIINMLLHSNTDIINQVIETIKNKFSVDDEDFKVTLNISLVSLPTIFVKEPYGCFETFMKNVTRYEEWGINLMGLFDFSREIFVADHDLVKKNYKTATEYEISVDDKNAKYFLLLPDLATRIDYFVEVVANDTMRGGTGNIFDGSEFVSLYPSKLNIVTDLTIKRLRYSSMNGKKIFGSKEKSLAGEITNLKVDVLNMPEDYLNSYFNNNFEEITSDEVTSYVDMVNKCDDYEVYNDEVIQALDNDYRQGLRYLIEGNYVSRNKVLRNYSVLRNSGIDKTKAIIFAVCYNLVVTKDEYKAIKGKLTTLGGM